MPDEDIYQNEARDAACKLRVLQIAKAALMDAQDISNMEQCINDGLTSKDCQNCVYGQGQCPYAEEFMQTPDLQKRLKDELTKGKNETVYADVESSFEVTKAKEDQQMVFGWANVSVKSDGTLPFDWQGDIKTPETLEKAAYNFVMKYRQTGEMHQGSAKGELVESVMFTKDKMAAMGIPEGVLPEGWWVGFHIPDKEVFAKVKSGKYKMFSIQGKAKRLPLI